MPRIHRLHTIIIFLFAFFIPDAASAQKNAGVDSLIEEWNREWKMMKQDTPVGISIGIYRNGVSQFYAVGRKQAKNAVYEIGSITKTFTCLLLAHAVAEGRLSLQDDIRRYLDDPYPNLEYNGEPIRIVHLATTTSGLPNDWDGKYWKDALKTVTLQAIPGTKPAHSNAAAQLLGKILERVYDRPLGRVIDALIMRPVGMRSTFFSTSRNHKGRRFSGYNGQGQAVPPFTDTAMLASAGLVSTASDLLRYAAYLMHDTGEAVRMALNSVVTIDAGTNLVTTRRVDTAADPGVYHYGLGWLRYNSAPGKLQVWADGGTDGFCSYLIFYPERKMAIVLLANQASEAVFRQLPKMAAEMSDGE